MPTSSALRLTIERSLQDRFPAALTPSSRTIREVAPTGGAHVDQLLDGGFPVGAISELTGPDSSGRTSLTMLFLARRTVEGKVCAWVDASDAFDPESAAANGVSLPQLLWVRCRDVATPSRSRSTDGGAAQYRKPWARLEQALRATDLLLQAGGFAAIVLDLGDMAPEHGRRIPLATWFRFRQAADRTRCCLVVLGKAAYAQSSAALVLKCAPMQAHAKGGTVLHGFTCAVERERERFAPALHDGRKPPAAAWTAEAVWSAGRRA